MSNLEFLSELGIDDVNLGGFSTEWYGSGSDLESIAPSNGNKIATIRQCSSGDYEKIMQDTSNIFKKWRMEPAPKRGEVVRLLANEFRKQKIALGKLISWEMGRYRQKVREKFRK